jgi:hypothetical protein
MKRKKCLHYTLPVDSGIFNTPDLALHLTSGDSAVDSSHDTSVDNGQRTTGMPHSPHAALFDVLCGPTHFSNYTRCGAHNAPVLINVKFQMHVK